MGFFFTQTDRRHKFEIHLFSSLARNYSKTTYKISWHTWQRVSLLLSRRPQKRKKSNFNFFLIPVNALIKTHEKPIYFSPSSRTLKLKSSTTSSLEITYTLTLVPPQQTKCIHTNRRERTQSSTDMKIQQTHTHTIFFFNLKEKWELEEEEKFAYPQR